MPTLVENRTPIKVALAKPTGLNELGVPLLASTAVKKGKLQEFAQVIEGGQIGRRFQNLRITAVKTSEGTLESAKLFVQFEAFGDDNVPIADNSGFAVMLSHARTDYWSYRRAVCTCLTRAFGMKINLCSTSARPCSTRSTELSSSPKRTRFVSFDATFDARSKHRRLVSRGTALGGGRVLSRSPHRDTRMWRGRQARCFNPLDARSQAA